MKDSAAAATKRAVCGIGVFLGYLHFKIKWPWQNTANQQILTKYPCFPPLKHRAIAVFMDILPAAVQVICNPLCAIRFIMSSERCVS